MKKGDYFTLVGSYEGVAWTGREWQRFLCQGCAIQLGLAKTRLQGPMTPKAAEALKGKVFLRHSISIHNLFLQGTKGLKL